MLIPKQINIKKAGAYITVIAIMIGGSGYLLYINFQMTKAGTSPMMEFVDLENIGPLADLESGSSAESPVTGQKKNNAAELEKILTSEKFRNLKDNFENINNSERDVNAIKSGNVNIFPASTD